MSYSDNFPSQRASLLMDFSNGGRIDPRATFSRSDSPIDASKAAASAVHYWSNEKHLSSENLLLDSKTGTANWTEAASGSAATPTITANHAASPNGTASQATRVQLNLNGASDTSSNSRYNQSINLPSGDSVTFSVWLKSTDGASSYAIQVYQADGNAAAATVTGSWQKFTTTATAAASAAFGIRVRGGQSPTNADTADVLMWGANASSIGQTVLSETTTSIHRQYAPTLKSVANAGQPRFEYDPATDGQSVAKGILIESQATNLVTYSETLATGWTENRSTLTAASGVAPDGTLTSNLWTVDGTASNSHNAIFDYTTGGATPQTASVYAKAGNVNYLIMRFSPANGAFTDGYVSFNLSNGTVGTTNGTMASSEIVSCGNGWFRCSITGTALTNATGRLALYIAQADNTISFDGNSYDHIQVWGAQIEANQSFASSYIKSNSGSTTTRAAESLSMTDSSLFDTGSGAIICELGPVDGKVYPTAFALTDSSTQNIVRCQGNNGATQMSLVVNADNGGVATITQSFTSTGTKLGVSYDTNSFKFCTDGGTVDSDTAGQVPEGLNRLEIGGDTYTSSSLNGHCKRIAVYPALTDTNLQALTS